MKAIPLPHSALVLRKFMKSYNMWDLQVHINRSAAPIQIFRALEDKLSPPLTQVFSTSDQSVFSNSEGFSFNPVLLMYIYDIHTCFKQNFKICWWHQTHHRARNTNGITELQEDIHKMVEWENKWQVHFNVDKYSVMHIGHNNIHS